MTRQQWGMAGLRVALIALAVGLVLAHRMPWWLAVVIALREVVLAIAVLVHRLVYRARRPESVAVGPVGTLGAGCLATGLVLIGLLSGTGSAADVVRVFGWSLAGWGVGLSWTLLVIDVGHLARLFTYGLHRVPSDG